MKKFIFHFLTCLLNLFPIGYCSFELIVLHNNDMKGKYDQTTKYMGYCRGKELYKNKCVGGLPRIISEVERIRKLENERRHVIYLYSGNIFHGSLWSRILGPSIVYKLMNILKPDVVALGTHEFVIGIENLTKYVSKLHTKIVAANVDLSRSPKLKKHIKPWAIIEKGGHKIGVIGYTSKNTPEMAGELPGIGFNDETTFVRAASEQLQSLGVKFIIALGNGGFAIDRNIAMIPPLVNLVVGGNHAKLFYNGPAPCIEEVDGGYPFVVKSIHNKMVPLLYAYAFSKYLGQLSITFDDNGEMKDFSGQTIYLNNSITQNEQAVKILNKYRPRVLKVLDTSLGTMKVLLEGKKETCRRRECNFGNLMADSLIHHAVKHLTSKDSSNWTVAPISLVKGNSIFHQLDFTRTNQNITMGNISRAVPFQSTLVTFEIDGLRLLQALETALEFQKASKATMFQVSGLKVVYNPKSENRRVVSLQVRCAACSIPYYENIDADAIYSVISTKQVLERSTATRFFDAASNVTTRLFTDCDALAEYIEDTGIVFPEIEERIRFVKIQDMAVRMPPLSTAVVLCCYFCALIPVYFFV